MESNCIEGLACVRYLGADLPEYCIKKSTARRLEEPYGILTTIEPKSAKTFINPLPCNGN